MTTAARRRHLGAHRAPLLLGPRRWAQLTASPGRPERARTRGRDVPSPCPANADAAPPSPSRSAAGLASYPWEKGAARRKPCGVRSTTDPTVGTCPRRHVPSGCQARNPRSCCQRAILRRAVQVTPTGGPKVNMAKAEFFTPWPFLPPNPTRLLIYPSTVSDTPAT